MAGSRQGTVLAPCPINSKCWESEMMPSSFPVSFPRMVSHAEARSDSIKIRQEIVITNFSISINIEDMNRDSEI